MQTENCVKQEIKGLKGWVGCQLEQDGQSVCLVESIKGHYPVYSYGDWSIVKTDDTRDLQQQMFDKATKIIKELESKKIIPC